MIQFFKNLFNRRYVSIQDIVMSYNPSTQQVGVRKGALDNVNMKRFRMGNPFEFNGSTNPFVILPKANLGINAQDALQYLNSVAAYKGITLTIEDGICMLDDLVLEPLTYGAVSNWSEKNL